MIAHIFRLLWNRKAANLLILLEIAVSFLVVFAVVAFAVFSWSNARRPLGYEPENLWSLHIGGNNETGDTEASALRQSLEQQLVREVAQLDAMEAVGVLDFPPFSGATSERSWDLNDTQLLSEVIRASEGTQEVLGVELLEGRWFEEGDGNLPYKPVVINRRLALEAFGDQPALGANLQEANPERNSVARRVIGVFEDFRKRGDFAAPNNIFFSYREELDPERGLGFIGMRVQPGTQAQLQEQILERVSRVAPEWSFSLQVIAESREEYRRSRLMQLLLAGLVAGFLVIMVALGLLGVLWQNVTQRTQEIGLRRANGAHAGNVYRQILSEILAVAVVALGLGSLVLLQLPITGWFESLTPEIGMTAFSISVSFMLILTVLCGLYPSWLATRVHPAEALHYE